MILTEIPRIYSFRLKNVKITAELEYSFSAASPLSASPPGEAENPSRRDKTALYFVFEDSIILRTGQSSTDFQNCIAVVPPRIPIHAERTSDYCILFTFDTEGDTASAFARFMDQHFRGKKIFAFPVIKEEIRTYLDDLLYTLTHPDECSDEIAVSLLKILFYHIFIYNQTQRGERTTLENYLALMEAMIRMHSTDTQSPLTLTRLAEELHLSKKHTSRLLMRHYGKTLSAILAEKRLERACFLLANTNLSVSEITKAVCFQSENYFFRKFREAFGTTPLHYRHARRAQPTSFDPENK